jgi:hypothetical protein
MIKKFLLGIFIVSLLATCALAQAEPRLFLGIYWVTGEVVCADPLISVDGRGAILYPSTGDPLYENMRVQSNTSGGGKFVLNPFYNRNLPVTFEANYYSVAALRGTDNYGANAVNHTLSPLGHSYAHLTLALGAGPGYYVLDDTGWVRSTTISREGEHLRLSWTYAPGPVPANDVKIYRSSGVDAQYVADVARFPDVFTVAPGERTYIDTNTAHDGKNYYYRVVPDDPAADPNIFAPANNSINVGKIEVALPVNKYVFCALPFMDDGVSLANQAGEQIGPDGEFLWWDGVGYHGATYTGTSWTGEDRMLRISEGLIFRAKADARAALVGRFGTFSIPAVRNLPATRYSLLAYPYPIPRAFEAMGITPGDNSDLLRWMVDGQAYEGATYSGGAWVGPAGINNLELGRPRFYRPRSSYDWTIIFP